MTTGRGEKKAQEGKIRSRRGKTFLHHTTATKHPGFEERDRREKGERGGLLGRRVGGDRWLPPSPPFLLRLLFSPPAVCGRLEETKKGWGV